jgi:CubicO group peptidase (beta-lactamase class C family)
LSLATRVDAAIDAALGSRIVGCVVLVSQGGELVYARAAGLADREAATPVATNTIFRLASVTKPIVAATALRMIDLGLLSLDDTVAKYLPYFTPASPDGTVPDILIRHLLTHTSGITYNIPDDVSRGSDNRDLMPLTENLRRLSKAPLAFAPGSQWEYGMSIDVLGGVLAAINRSDLAAVVAKYVTGPLGMVDTHFVATNPARLAVPYADGQPPVRMDEPHGIPNEARGSIDYFSPARIFEPRAAQAGGSGMAGTASDFLKLLEAVQTGDFLAPATRDAAIANQIGALSRPDAGQKFSFLGAYIDDPAASGWPVAGMLHWGGVWGNNWIFEPKSATSVVVFTNTMMEGCNGPFRGEVRDAVFG